MPIASLFSDGGVVLKNPSPIAGTWAFCGVDDHGFRVLEDGGFVLVNENEAVESRVIGRSGTTITNNQMEWAAAMQAIECMEDGWTGTLHTDSIITIRNIQSVMERLNDPNALVPTWMDWQWYRRVAMALRRLGKVELQHVKGHPTRVDLRRGYTVDENGARKYLVSPHQVWCDMECKRQDTRARLSIGGSRLMERYRLSGKLVTA